MQLWFGQLPPGSCPYLVFDLSLLGSSLGLRLLPCTAWMAVGACFPEDALNDLLYAACWDGVGFGDAAAVGAERNLSDEGDLIYWLYNAAVRTHPRRWSTSRQVNVWPITRDAF